MVKKGNKFNTDLEITSREIPSHLQVLDVLVNKPFKVTIKSNMISEYDYRMNDVVWLDTVAWKKILSDNIIYSQNLGGSEDDIFWEIMSETQNLTLVMIKRL